MDKSKIKNKTVYISGGISGVGLIQATNRFKLAKEMLLSYGFKDVINPFDLHESQDKEWNEFMSVDLAEMMKGMTDGLTIALLPDWNKSNGSVAEVMSAIASMKYCDISFILITSSMFDDTFSGFEYTTKLDILGIASEAFMSLLKTIDTK